MIRAALVALIIFLSAGTAYAQVDVQAQIEALLKKIGELQHQLANISIAPPTGSAPFVGVAPGTTANTELTCPVFSRTLSRGAEGDDVRELQKLLQSGNYLTAAPTGYFGSLTEKALQNFQTKTKLVTGGSPATTGWGVFGPRTRNFIASLCANELQKRLTPLVVPSVPSCPAVAEMPSNDLCVGIWQKLQDGKGCDVGWKCFVSQTANSTNKAPTIESVDGATTFLVGDTGVWTIAASDPEGGTLHYGVIWGDEGAGNILSLLAGYDAPAFTSSSRISHSYSAAGRYTADIHVRDAAGNTAYSALTVIVGPRTSSSPPPVIGTAATAQASSGSCAFTGVFYPEGTETEGRSVADLCLTTGGACQPSSAYMPKFKCVSGAWASALTNPFPNLPAYGNVVGTECSSNGATRQVVVWPNTQLCRGLLCAIAQSYTQISLTCQYVNWVDWGLFRAGATTTTVCAAEAPCEYWFGSDGRACAPKQNGSCPVPQTGHPLGT